MSNKHCAHGAHARTIVTMPRRRFACFPLKLACGTAAVLCSLGMLPSAHANTPFPLAGQWNCSSSPIAIPAMHGIPAGMLHQRIAYAADTSGRWTSNGISDFVFNTDRDRYRMRTTAQGHSLSDGNLVEERIQQLRILKPFDAGTAFAAKHGPTLNAITLAAVQKRPGNLYSLTFTSPTAYQLQALNASGKSGRVIVRCTRAGKETR
ncbi:MAG: hypothetical protein Q4G70_09700 [Pseudomonadota bacterium]|nr:hypothetical protein [Pseudomonadota bacterium]